MKEYKELTDKEKVVMLDSFVKDANLMREDEYYRAGYTEIEVLRSKLKAEEFLDMIDYYLDR